MAGSECICGEPSIAKDDRFNDQAGQGHRGGRVIKFDYANTIVNDDASKLFAKSSDTFKAHIRASVCSSMPEFVRHGTIVRYHYQNLLGETLSVITIPPPNVENECHRRFRQVGHACLVYEPLKSGGSSGLPMPEPRGWRRIRCPTCYPDFTNWARFPRFSGYLIAISHWILLAQIRENVCRRRPRKRTVHMRWSASLHESSASASRRRTCWSMRSCPAGYAIARPSPATRASPARRTKAVKDDVKRGWRVRAMRGCGAG